MRETVFRRGIGDPLTDEIAEVAMALLPFLLKANAKDDHSKQPAYLHFLSVSTWLKEMNFIFE